MSLSDRFVFLHSRQIPSWTRNLLIKALVLKNRLVSLARMQRQLFTMASIEISHNCNRRCSYCPVSHYPEHNAGKMMDVQTFRKIVDDLTDIGFEGTVFFSGYTEPLRHPELLRMIQYARRRLKKSKIAIYTNGDYLTKELFQSLRRYSVILQVTQHEPVDEAHYSFLQNLGHGYKSFFLRRAISGEHLSTRGGLVNIDNPEKKSFCAIPSVQLSVDVDGNVVLCCDDYFSTHTYGNVHVEALYTIWRKKEFKKVRRLLLHG
ncbi:MAG: radical SAM/SPASM domain-containing protein, partial [Nanoarchaeota archaeon]